MAVFTILLAFVGAYLLFMGATYFLARVFFPLEASPENTTDDVHLRRLTKQADRHLRKRPIHKGISTINPIGKTVSPA